MIERDPRMLLIGWDGADWDFINPLLDSGRMPTLKRLIEHGTWGGLASGWPLLSPILWNSIATGKRADKHGILNFTEPDPLTGKLRPVLSTTRKAKAVWNILSEVGYRTHVIGWFAGHPAESINGVAISPLYPLAGDATRDEWKADPLSVSPQSMLQTLADLRVHPSDISDSEVLRYVQGGDGLSETDVRGRILLLKKVLAETYSIYASTSWLLKNTRWNFAAAYFGGLDHVSHYFIEFLQREMHEVAPHKHRMFQDVVTQVYCRFDSLLGSLLEHAGRNVTLILVSDHGFYSDDVRQRHTREFSRNAHRPYGIVCCSGPHIRSNKRIECAEIFDIAPTVLSMFDTPIGEDFDGKVLKDLFVHPVNVKTIPTWEFLSEVKADSVAAVNQSESQALLQQFSDLGYIDLPTDDDEGVKFNLEDSKFNLAQVQLDAGKTAEAASTLQELVNSRHDGLRFSERRDVGIALQLSQAYFQIGRTQEARLLLESLRSSAPENGADWIDGLLFSYDGRREEALGCFLRIEKRFPNWSALASRIGFLYLGACRFERAESAFRRALAADPDSANAHVGFAIVRLRRRDFESAALAATRASNLKASDRVSRYLMAICHMYTGQRDEAQKCFEMCAAISPQPSKVHYKISVAMAKCGKAVANSAEHGSSLAIGQTTTIEE